MTSQEIGGLSMLAMIVIIIAGSFIFGAKFWFWFFLIGSFVIGIAVLMWVLTLLTGVTRWAKRQN